MARSANFCAQGPLGQMLQDKIRGAILSAMQKGTDLGATLPPVIQGYATIQNAQFKNAGAGRLIVVLDGKLQNHKRAASDPRPASEGARRTKVRYRSKNFASLWTTTPNELPSAPALQSDTIALSWPG